MGILKLRKIIKVINFNILKIGIFFVLVFILKII